MKEGGREIRYIFLKKVSQYVHNLVKQKATNHQLVLINYFDIFNSSGWKFSHLHADFDHDASTISHTLYL